ncbi:hypothetical protein EV715DRAFT_198726 [Schizophyllum commune]
MSDHSDDKCCPDQPISERARTGRSVSYARTQLGESGQSATNANMRRPLRAPSPHERAPQQPHPFTSFPRTGLIPWPSPAPQAFLPMPEYSIASRSYFGALASPTESSSHATRHGLPTIRYPLSSPSIAIPEVPPIRHTLHALLQRVPSRHRSGASNGSGHLSDTPSTSSAEDVRRIDGYLADDSSIEQDTADGSIDEARNRAASKEAAGHSNGDVAAEGGNKDDLVITIEHPFSTRSDGETSAHSNYSEYVDVDELDSEEYVDVRTRYHDTGSWHDAQGLDRVLRDRDARQEVEILPRCSLVRQTVAGGFLSTAAYPLAGEREAGPSSSGDEHDRGDEGRDRHPPQVDLQLEQASWTPTSAPMSSTGIASQHEPSPPVIRPSIPNLLNVEDMEVPRPWGPSAGIADQLVASATASPRGANRHMDTGATSLTATDATGQGAQTPAGMIGSHSICNRFPILLGPGSSLSIRLSAPPPTLTTKSWTAWEGAEGAGHNARDPSSPISPRDDLEAVDALLLISASENATRAGPSPSSYTELLPPDTNQGDVLSPDTTSATLTGGTINIGLPEVDTSAFTESAKAPVPELHDSQCGQQGQSPRPLLAHPPSPRPPSRTSMPSSAPHQESPIPPPSPTSDNDKYSDIWAAKLRVVWEVVNGELELDEDVQSGLSSAEHAANPPSTTRTAVVPLNEGSDEKENRKRASKGKKTVLIDNAREAYARAIDKGGPFLLDVIRKADRVESQRFPDIASWRHRPQNSHAGTQECLDENSGNVLNGTATSRALEGAARDQSLGNLLGAANEEQLEFESQDDIEQGDMDRCTPFILWVVHRSRDETMEQAIARGRLEIQYPVRRLFFDSWNRAIATDRNNPPAADSHSGSYASTPPARGPMNPVYPAQTRVVVFVACENAYTFTVAELGDDESPLRAPEGTQGSKKGAKKGSKKGGKKGSKKGGQQDQDPVEMLPRRTFTRPEAVPVDYGNWDPPTRAFIEARALEAEGVPEDLLEEPADNGAVAQDNASDSEGANVNGRRDQGRDDGCGAGDSQLGQFSELHAKGKRSTAKENKGDDEDEDEKKKNARPPPELRSRREILNAHSDWSPIRYGDRRLGEDLRQILADVHAIMLLSYPHWNPMPGTRSILDTVENAREQNADNDVQGRGTRSKGKKRQRAEDEDEEAHDAGPSRPAKKRKGKTAPTTSSQRAPAAPSPQPPAPRGNKRRRDEATEDAAPAPKRTRRDEEPAGSANPRPSARASTSQAPRMIAPASLVQVWPSLNESLKAAYEQQSRESMSRPSASAASVSRQPPRPLTYRPPPGPAVAGPSRPPVAGPPSRQPIAGPSRPNRKRRRGDETDDDEDDEDYVDEGGPVTWESGRRAKKPKRR